MSVLGKETQAKPRHLLLPFITAFIKDAHRLNVRGVGTIVASQVPELNMVPVDLLGSHSIAVANYPDMGAFN